MAEMLYAYVKYCRTQASTATSQLLNDSRRIEDVLKHSIFSGINIVN